MSPLSKLRSGFTLIELTISVTILSIIMLSVFVVYSHIITLNKRLDANRLLQENTRNITERIANDVRNNGISFSYYDGSTTDKNRNYTASGSSILAVKDPNLNYRYYTYYAMKKDPITGTYLQCLDSDLLNVNTHCFLGLQEWIKAPVSITDDFVRLQSLRFFISGKDKDALDSRSNEWKVTLVFSLGIDKSFAGGQELVKTESITTQTTISEKMYKSDN